MKSVTIWRTDPEADNYPFPHQIGERLKSPAKNLEGIVRDAKYAGTEDGNSSWITYMETDTFGDVLYKEPGQPANAARKEISDHLPLWCAFMLSKLTQERDQIINKP